MNSLSALDPLAWEPQYFSEHPAYIAGNALGWLYRSGNKHAATSYPLAGRLYLAKSGWLLLSVPNALVRGVFDALVEPGTELPTAGVFNVPNVESHIVNAHISVMSADEVASIGENKINERGHMFGYTLGGLKEIDVKNVAGVSKVWAIQISSPALSALRKSYGLSPLPNEDHPFHITVAARRKGVLLDNGKAKGYETAAENTDGQRFRNPISRGELKAAADITARDNIPAPGVNLSRSGQKDLLAGGKGDNLPDREISADSLAEGAKHAYEHTRNDQGAKETAEDHLPKDPQYGVKTKNTEKHADHPPAIKTPHILAELRAAKHHSDRREYDRKHKILRRIIAQAPQDWHVDDPKPKYPGVTHTPTRFRFHAPRGVIGAHVKAAENSVYAQQFRNLLNFRTPIMYDNNKPVYANVVDHLLKAKQRGDFIMSARNKSHIYRSTLDPRYRYQMAQAAATGSLPQMNMFDKATQLYGNDVFDTIQNWGKKNV
jgi:hypothetical protein